MDPLSIAASVVGLLTAAAKIGTVLETLSAAKDCPTTIQDARAEVRHTELALTSLQQYLHHLDLLDPQRAGLIQVDELRITLGDAMLVFAEFESYLGLLSSMTRAQVSITWTRHAKKIDEYRAKIQRYSSSLNLMLSILQCKSHLEAMTNQRRLQSLVEEVLVENKTLKHLLMQSEDTGNSFAFENILQESWVYRRNERNECDASFVSSVQRSHAWSVFSGYSLADISILSVIAMPITLRDIANNRHYEVTAARDCASELEVEDPLPSNGAPMTDEYQLPPSSTDKPDSPVAEVGVHDTDDDEISSGEDGDDSNDNYDEDAVASMISSSPSLPDDEDGIEFEFMHALHKFVATVEGQLNVTKGETLVLLDDSNQYWWLVRIVHNSEIGYIPAEFVETPVERLGRLNKHRNVDITGALPIDFGSTLHVSKTRTGPRKTVTFDQSPSYISRPPEDDDSSDEEIEDDDVSGEEENADSIRTALRDRSRSSSPAKWISNTELVDESHHDAQKEVRRVDLKLPTSTESSNAAGKPPDPLDLQQSLGYTLDNDTTITRKISLTPDWLRGAGDGDGSASTGRLDQDGSGVFVTPRSQILGGSLRLLLNPRRRRSASKSFSKSYNGTLAEDLVAIRTNE
ncbi:hypothetical protein B0H66DRAFT_569177 [Apodospora peruviana]|uniref:SH3 domain-containing protein n=1 Tax=Apodospora peruviana TaxID=516989 RepID=A0AAE0HUN2_9PEZI|nr:hypothetical protein B0H66DRAFT_569177 [Apodospora peruviana]